MLSYTLVLSHFNQNGSDAANRSIQLYIYIFNFTNILPVAVSPHHVAGQMDGRALSSTEMQKTGEEKILN